MPTTSLTLVTDDIEIARLAPSREVPPAPAITASPTVDPLWRRLAARRGQMLRIGLGLALAGAGVSLYAPDVLYTTSSEAVLNARTISVMAPIDGRVTQAPPAEGTKIAAGAPLMTIENAVVDRSRLGELETSRTRTAAELAAAKQLIATLRQQSATLDEQAAAYRQGVVARLELAVREAEADLTAAEATAAEAGNTVARKRTLATAGWISGADLDKAEAGAARAQADTERARAAVARRNEELAAARNNVFVTDNNNGAPYAQQRVDEFRLRLAEAEAQSGALDARLAQLDDQLAAERDRVAKLAAAELKAPVAGVVWRPNVAAGSTVGHDREMLTLIDCSNVFVTANFSSRQFDNLRPGARASVRVADSGAEYAGTVVDVRAVNGGEADGHFAAPLPKLGAKQVMALLRLDDPGAMTGEKYCNVGRRVDVRFNDLSPAKADQKVATDVR